jgi:hypothetical protein
LEVNSPSLFFSNFNFFLVWASTNVLNSMNLEKHSPFHRK